MSYLITGNTDKLNYLSKTFKKIRLRLLTSQQQFLDNYTPDRIQALANLMKGASLFKLDPTFYTFFFEFLEYVSKLIYLT